MLFGVLCLPRDQSHPFAQPTINPLPCCICWAGLLGPAVFPPWNEGPNSGSCKDIYHLLFLSNSYLFFQNIISSLFSLLSSSETLIILFHFILHLSEPLPKIFISLFYWADSCVIFFQIYIAVPKFSLSPCLACFQNHQVSNVSYVSCVSSSCIFFSFT